MGNETFNPYPNPAAAQLWNSPSLLSKPCCSPALKLNQSPIQTLLQPSSETHPVSYPNPAAAQLWNSTSLLSKPCCSSAL